MIEHRISAAMLRMALARNGCFVLTHPLNAQPSLTWDHKPIFGQWICVDPNPFR